MSLIWAAFTYLTSTDERRQQQQDQRRAKQYQAWLVVNSATSGSGGRIQALEDLVRDRVPLQRIDLHGAWLQGVRLQGADLTNSILRGADLSGACLRNASLHASDLEYALLRQADLTEADCVECSLVEADLRGADVTGASFWAADLRAALLPSTIKGIATLEGANVYGAYPPDDFPQFFTWALREKGAYCNPREEERPSINYRVSFTDTDPAACHPRPVPGSLVSQTNLNPCK